MPQDSPATWTFATDHKFDTKVLTKPAQTFLPLGPVRALLWFASALLFCEQDGVDNGVALSVRGQACLYMFDCPSVYIFGPLASFLRFRCSPKTERSGQFANKNYLLIFGVATERKNDLVIFPQRA